MSARPLPGPREPDLTGNGIRAGSAPTKNNLSVAQILLDVSRSAI
jgi:hypothetical protein